MTGVSLAGTQLRVNQYNMHDTEWNDVKVSEIRASISKWKHSLDSYKIHNPNVFF